MIVDKAVDRIKMKDNQDTLMIEDDGSTFIPTPSGDIGVYLLGDSTSSKGTVFFLHGYGRKASALGSRYQWLALNKLGYRTVAIDMPGFGRTNQLERLKSRSERNMDKNGPVEIVLNIMNFLGIKTAEMISGYDWGAGIAFDIAINHPRRVKRLVAIHAMYSNVKALTKVKQPCLILWVKQEQFPPLKMGKKMHKAMPRGEMIVFDGGPYSQEKAGNSWRIVGDKILQSVLTHVGEELKAADVVELLSLSKKDNVKEEIFIDREEEFVELKREGSTMSSQEAVVKFKEIWKNGKLPLYYGALLGKGPDSQKLRPETIAMFAQLPLLTREVLQHPDDLLKLGLWEKQPKNFDKLSQAERYPI